MNRLTKILFGLMVSTSLFAQVIMLQPKDGAISRLNHISVTIAGKAGAPAKLFINDSLMRENDIRIDGILDFLNVEVPVGPIKIRVEALGASDRTFTAERTIHVLGPLAKITALSGVVDQPADGRTVLDYKFEFSDAWDYKLRNIANATVNLSSGAVINEDVDQDLVGHQVRIEEGVLTVSIQSPTEATDLGQMEIQARGYSAFFDMLYSIPEEPLLVVGAVNGALSSLSKGQDPDGLPHFGIINENNKTLGSSALVGGRAAFYAKGSIKPGLRLTASLDTDRGYLDQLFVDVDPDELYPLLGDASSIEYDVQSRSKLFAKLEQSESFLLFGDYNTNITDNEFTAYNRTFNGLLGRYILKDHELQLFGTATDRSMRQEEIRGEGISGFYYLSIAGGNTVTRFSEKIRLVTKDRYHPEVILETRDLTRFFDYDINYVDGTLMFKQPVAAMDGNGNPIFIVISYEFQGGSARSWIGGMRHKSRLNLGKFSSINVGTSFITEQRGDRAYLLYGVDGSMPISDLVSVSTEIAQSRSPAALSDSVRVGTAFRAEVTAQPVEKLVLSTYLRTVGDDFSNASQVGSGSETGSFKYGVNAQYESDKFGRITSEFYDQSKTQGTSITANSTVFNINAMRKMNERSDLKLGYEFAHRERLNAADSTLSDDYSNLLKGEYSVLLLDQVEAVFEHEQNLNFKNRTKPTNSSIGLVYPITEKLDVFYKFRFIQGTSVNRQSVLGFRSSVNETTEIEGKYEIGGITGEQRNKASIGLNNKWHLREDLVVNIALENTATVDSFEIPTPEHQAAALSFEYLPDMPWKAVGKYEVRDDASTLQRVMGFGGDMRILAGFGAIVKLDHWESRYKTGNKGSLTRDNFQGGLAYRPENADKINALAKFSYISERNTNVATPYRQDRYILSAHSYWQITPVIGLGSRVATRYVFDEDKSFAEDVTTQTYFLQSRGEFIWTDKISSMVDFRYIRMQPQGESLFGLAVEGDYLIMKNLQFGIGYILKDFSDPDFTFLEYTYHNFYFTLHSKFSEDIFNWR